MYQRDLLQRWPQELEAKTADLCLRKALLGLVNLEAARVKQDHRAVQEVGLQLRRTATPWVVDSVQQLAALAKAHMDAEAELAARLQLDAAEARRLCDALAPCKCGG